MKQPPKIATCCYCGHRTVLDLRGVGRHELACAACGAPLRYLKQLPVNSTDPKPKKKLDPPKAKAPKTQPVKTKPKPEKRKKRKKSFFQRAVEEFWDELEDIFD